MSAANIQQIDALLPQTQCTRCGYEGCRPYAEAIASGDAEINRCPPGGDATVRRLAEHTGNRVKPIDPECGEVPQRLVAFIREAECIGCTRCIQVCPVDAILGAAKQMHTVIADECTGCELCVPACPVDCIDLPVAMAGEGQVQWPTQSEHETARAARARQRFDARAARLQRQQAEKTAQRRRRKAALQKKATATDDAGAKKSEITAAIARAKARRKQRSQQ